jgi:nucleoside-diphosphate kinase
VSRTLGLVKPDAFAKKRVGKIITYIEERCPLTIAAVRLELLTPERAREFYAEHRGKPFFERLTRFMVSGPVLAMRLETNSPDAFAIWRKHLEVVRTRFRSGASHLNSAHGSDSNASAERELAFFGLI